MSAKVRELSRPPNLVPRSVVLALVGAGAVWLAFGRGGDGSTREQRAPAHASEHRAPEAAIEPAVAPKTADLEAAIMQRLHAIGETDPAAALGLALEGNARFPASADAPERGWIICRSLVDLRRFSEAVAEARVMVEQYPDTPWALDVERHLLVNPMSDPSERGYGHEHELE